MAQSKDAGKVAEAPTPSTRTPITDAPEEHRDLGGNPPERTSPLDTPDDTLHVGDTGPGRAGRGTGHVDVVYDASGPTRVLLHVYPGSTFSVPAHVAADLLAASPQFRMGTTVDEKFPGLRAGSDSGKPEDVQSGYEDGPHGSRGAGAFDPAVVAANMPSVGEGNERSAAYADDVLKAARVTEEGVRSGRDVAATIVGPELTGEPGREPSEPTDAEAEEKLRRLVGRG